MLRAIANKIRGRTASVDEMQRFHEVGEFFRSLDVPIGINITLVRKSKIRDNCGDVYILNEFSDGSRACYLHKKGWLSSAVEGYTALGVPEDLSRIFNQYQERAESVRINPGVVSDYEWSDITEKAKEMGMSSSGIKDLFHNVREYARTTELSFIPKLATTAFIFALATMSYIGKANAQESFFDDPKLRFYSDTSIESEVQGDQILRLGSRGLDLGVEYNDAGKVKAFGSNLKLDRLNFRTIAEKNEEFINYELKLRRKFIEGLTAAVGFGKVDNQGLSLIGFNYKNLGNPDFDWGIDGGYVRLKGDDKVVGDAWINLKKMLAVRDVFLGARYDELDQLFLVASLPSDDGWALRFFRKNNFSKGNQSELNRLVFSTKARPTFMDDSYSYFLVDIDAFRNTNTYIKNPLRYIVPAFHHMGQGSDDGLETIVVTELLKTPRGDRILKGEFDTYLTKGFWLGVNGIYNLESDEKIIGIPFGFYHKIGNLRIEPLYNLKEKGFSGLVVADLDYKF